MHALNRKFKDCHSGLNKENDYDCIPFSFINDNLVSFNLQITTLKTIPNLFKLHILFLNPFLH